MFELIVFLCVSAVATWWLFWRVEQGPYMRLWGGVSLTLVYWFVGMPLMLAFGISAAFMLGVWMLPRADAP